MSEEIEARCRSLAEKLRSMLEKAPELEGVSNYSRNPDVPPIVRLLGVAYARDLDGLDLAEWT